MILAVDASSEIVGGDGHGRGFVILESLTGFLLKIVVYYSVGHFPQACRDSTLQVHYIGKEGMRRTG